MHGMGSLLLLASSLSSALLFAGLIGGYVTTGSMLALAQALDSFADALTSAGLLWVWNVSSKPADANHHYGYQTAQPIAAVIMATLIGVMALEILWSASAALIRGTSPTLTWFVASMLGLKVLARLLFLGLARRTTALRHAPAIQAFIVDARSDVVAGSVALLGFAGSMLAEMPSLDAWLALPAAAWIGFSAFRLARENIGLLMGIAPPQSWHDTQVDRLRKLVHVRRVGQMKARTFSDGIHVWVEILVDPALSIAEAHAIGELAEAALRSDASVRDAVVHVDADRPTHRPSPTTYGPAADSAAAGDLRT